MLVLARSIFVKVGSGEVNVKMHITSMYAHLS
jgi:hypothetical protein